VGDLIFGGDCKLGICSPTVPGDLSCEWLCLVGEWGCFVGEWRCFVGEWGGGLVGEWRCLVGELGCLVGDVGSSMGDRGFLTSRGLFFFTT
jgi:hypothetical protein